MALAAVLGLVTCVCGVAERPVRARRLVPHLVMAATMAAMTLPEGADPLGSLGWCLVLTATVCWTAWDDGHPGSVRGGGEHHLASLAARLPVAYDLLGMAGLLFVRWRADPTGAHGHEHMASDGWAVGAVAVVALWAVARFGAVPRASPPRAFTRIGGAAMAAAMTLMLLH